jgi:hypothetical protein
MDVLKQLTCLALTLVLASAVLSDGISGPLSLSDVRQLRREGKKPLEVVEVARRRGLSFAIDKKTDRMLRTLGFRKSMIDKLKSSAIDLDAAVDDPHKPAAAIDKPNPSVKKPIDRDEEARNQAYAQRVQAMLAASRLRVTATPGANVTLIANPASTTKYSRVIGTIEAMIAKTFPEPLGAGPDRRSTYIVLCRNDAEYAQWVRTMFAINHRAGLPGFDERQTRFALASAASMPRGMSVINMHRVGSWTGRTVAYNLGFLYMQGVTKNQAPVALLCGFGSAAESNFDGNPQVMLGVASYSEAHVPKRSGNRWLGILRAAFAAGRADSIEQMFTNGIQSMEELQYAEVWSFTQLLANDPVRFSQLVAEIRDGKDALKSIRAIYEADEKLRKKWARLVLGAR